LESAQRAAGSACTARLLDADGRIIACTTVIGRIAPAFVEAIGEVVVARN